MKENQLGKIRLAGPALNVTFEKYRKLQELERTPELISTIEDPLKDRPNEIEKEIQDESA